MEIVHFLKVSSIRTPMLIQGSLGRTEINPMYFKWVSSSFFKRLILLRLQCFQEK